MKCDDCGKPKAQFCCILCESYYCRECAEIYDGFCDCVGPSILPIKEYNKIQKESKKVRK